MLEDNIKMHSIFTIIHLLVEKGSASKATHSCAKLDSIETTSWTLKKNQSLIHNNLTNHAPRTTLKFLTSFDNVFQNYL